MSTPYISIPAPIGRALKGMGFGGSRSRRAASLDSFSSSSGSSPQPGAGANRGRSGTMTPCLSGQSPAHHAHLFVRAGSVDYSSDPRASWEERSITPTVLGYEVMEERAKFTVYKVLVRKSWNESWIVFRRYTDFSRLNDKLKEMFPGFRLSLPPKRFFKDNYNPSFLEDRQLGLQNFLQNLVAHKDVANCLPVRDFLCLDDPPGPFDSLEESRAFCETLEECNQRLQKELQDKQREIHALRKMLEEQQLHINMLERSIQQESLTPESSCQLSAQGSESSVEGDVDIECSATEADQEMDEDDSCHVQSSRRSSCWCGPALSSSPPAVQITGGQLER